MGNQIKLDTMHERHRALTPPVAESYREAASVCLSRYHTSPAEITVSDNGSKSPAQLAWPAPDSRTLDAWANTTDTTEAGAYGCVIAGVELLRGLFAVRRAETGTGADYYLGKADSGEHDCDCALSPPSGRYTVHKTASYPRTMTSHAESQFGTRGAQSTLVFQDCP